MPRDEWNRRKDEILSSLPIGPAGSAKTALAGGSAGLFAILARNAPRAIVFRRGPSKLVRLIAWHTETDDFTNGQWFRGRIYERRCDLSPDGKYLVYFAASFRGPYYSWTAVSRPPYLTALALWPKGDCWAGGGQFENKRTLWLNHEGNPALAEGFARPVGITLCSGGWGGEDDPIYSLRLMRDGWRMAQPATRVDLSRRDRDRIGISFLFHPAEIWQRDNPRPDIGARLRMIHHGYGERDARWNIVSHEIVAPDSETVPLGRTDWADWDRNGDLLYAKEGKLFRLSPQTRGIFDPGKSRELADFNGDRFQAIPPPDWAKTW